MELKPCPFCADTPFLNKHGPKIDGHYLWQIGCENEQCPIHDVWGAGYSSKEEAIKAWNTRANEEE